VVQRVALDDGAGLNDRDLLDRFACGNEEAAFAAIFVLGVWNLTMWLAISLIGGPNGKAR
jgi:hypothetical protein